MKIGRRDFLKGLGAVVAGLLLPAPKAGGPKAAPVGGGSKAQLVGVHPVTGLPVPGAGRFILSYVFYRPDMGPGSHTAAAEYDKDGRLLRQWMDGKGLPLDRKLPVSLFTSRAVVPPKSASVFTSGDWRMTGC